MICPLSLQVTIINQDLPCLGEIITLLSNTNWAYLGNTGVLCLMMNLSSIIIRLSAVICDQHFTRSIAFST